MCYLTPLFVQSPSPPFSLRIKLSGCLLALLFSIIATQSYASSANGQEAIWEQALTQSIEDHEIKWLDSPEGRFIALYHNDYTGTLRGGIILLHGMGAHPDWPDVISPLRNTLPLHGWSTLSIQLPTFEKGGHVENYADTISDASQRIQASIDHYVSNGIGNIVLVGHGLGAVTGASYLASNPNAGVAAFIGISMPSFEHGAEWMQLSNTIEKFNLPMLDIYGSNDLDSVIDNADRRARAARFAGITASKNNQITGFQRSATAKGGFSKVGGFISYRKFQITGANHFFNGHEHTLSKRIIGWLKRHASGVTVQN